jgi:hypothetical protein
VPQFPRAHYQCHVGWGYLEQWLKDQSAYGLDLDPDFQRGHVWTRDQQRAYIEYVLQGGEVGQTLIFNCTNWDEPNKPGIFVLVDGKQRMEAVRAFLRDEIAVFGDNVCSEMGRLTMTGPTFIVRICKLMTKADTLRLYLSINAGGTPHSKTEINRVRRMLADEER